MSFKRFWNRRYIVPALILGSPVVIAVFVVFFGGVVMLLWNWLLPTLFGLPEITLLQGFGLFILGRLLFGGFGMGGGGGGQHSRHMTPEERERFRERMRDRYCDTPREAPTAGRAE